MTRKEHFDGLCDMDINIITDAIPEEYLPYVTELAADCDALTLRGCYDGNNFISPPWYEGVLSHAEDPMNLLVIRGIEQLSERAQTKFKDLLRTHGSYVTLLPDNCHLVVLAPKEFRMNPQMAAFCSRVYDA